MARKFGIEIEAGLKPGFRLADVSAALSAAGLGGRQHGYLGNDATAWVVKTDGSVPGGVEVVSPPLDFDDESQRGQVDRAVAAMALVCKPIPEAGIHVHVESRDLDARQVSAVARTFTHFEDVLYRLASSGWRTIRPGATQYARPLTDAQVTGLAKARTAQQVQVAYYGDAHRASYASGSHSDNSRYCGLNLHSHFYRGTIEFRIFNSSLNAKRVQTYIAVSMAIVQDARNGKLRSVNKAAKLGAMQSGTQDPAKLFFRFLTVVRYEAGMSLADYRNLKAIWKDSLAQAPLNRRY